MSHGQQSTPYGLPCDSWCREQECLRYGCLAVKSPVSETPTTASKPDPVADLCASIKDNIRLCDHGYIHITCGQCVALWLRG